MIKGVLNDINSILLPMYYALFFLGTSNTSLQKKTSPLGRLKSARPLDLRIQLNFRDAIWFIPHQASSQEFQRSKPYSYYNLYKQVHQVGKISQEFETHYIIQLIRCL